MSKTFVLVLSLYQGWRSLCWSPYADTLGLAKEIPIRIMKLGDSDRDSMRQLRC